jgi:hypothetical protein
MSQATISFFPSPSRSRKRTFATTGTFVSPGGLHVCRWKRSPPSPGGQGSGSGRVTGERASK